LKTVDLVHATLDGCVLDAQRERVVVTRNGRPVALIVGIEGLDQEQLELGVSERFWSLVTERRSDGTLSREELEERLRGREEKDSRSGNA
jgi:antitoxin (DNA-binding transcriptional repressor) of toxin-antitoxin stability system